MAAEATAHHDLSWDGYRNDGRRAPAGVYFLRLTAQVDGERWAATTRVVVLR